MFKEAKIGEFDFDLSFIYFKEEHCMQHQWLALNNPESEDFATI